MDVNDRRTTLTRVTPGYPMHETMRRYWLPALLSSDLPDNDSDPFRLKILGIDLVAFRDSEGRVGILDEHCCHRSASLCLGQVKEGGIRCIYHGWKYAVDGTVLDMPNVTDERLKKRIKQPAYKVQEAGGVIWVYMGPAELEPPLPHHPFFDVPESHRHIQIVVSNSSFTRVAEGVLDSSHVGVLHSNVASSDIMNDLSPELELADTSSGFVYAALRRARTEAGEPATSVRVTAFAFPNSVYINAAQKTLLIAMPVEDDLTHFFMIFWEDNRPLSEVRPLETMRHYYGIDDEGMDVWGLDRTTYNLPDRPNVHNNFLQDRAKMRSGESFSGMHRFIPEDFGVSASMGPVAKRPKENLVPSDKAIARYRGLMVANAERVVNGGEPAGLTPKHYPRAISATIGIDDKWQDLLDA